MPLQADSVSVCALTNSDWNSCSVLLPCIQDWLDDYEKNLSCALERGPFIQQILFAKLAREGRIFCTEIRCLTTATLLLASCTPTRTQHFVYVTWKIEENQSVNQSINHVLSPWLITPLKQVLVCLLNLMIDLRVIMQRLHTTGSLECKSIHNTILNSETAQHTRKIVCRAERLVNSFIS